MSHDGCRQVHGPVGQLIQNVNREFGVLTSVMSGVDDKKPAKKIYLFPHNQWARKGITCDSNTTICGIESVMILNDAST
jgi:hypothetical protein